MSGCSRFIAQGSVRWFEKSGISIDTQDRCDIRKQHQDKTYNLHSRIGASGSTQQLLMLHTSTFHTRFSVSQCFFNYYFDPLLDLTLPVKHTVFPGQYCICVSIQKFYWEFKAHLGVLAIRRVFSLVNMIANTKFLNCHNVFNIGVVWQ